MERSEVKWTLWRQDDNGSSAVIDLFDSRVAAEEKLRELEERGHKQHYWIEEDEGEELALNLVVLRAADLDASKQFYEHLGLRFARHKHGAGVEHYACELPALVLEIYPKSDVSSAGARIGFSVPEVDKPVESFRAAGYEILVEPQGSPWGRRAVVRDPDGHSVELTARRKPLPNES